MTNLQNNWTRILGMCLPGLSLFAAATCTPDRQESEEDLIARASIIHEKVITIDTHNDINPNNFVAERNYTMDLDTQVNLPKMENGGLDVSWMIVYVGQGALTPEGYADAHSSALAKFEAIHRLAEEIAPEQMEIAYTSADEIGRAHV